MSDRADLSRRDAIKKTLALGSIGYVAPMILGSATPASAQVSGSGCSSATPVCDEQAIVACSNGQSDLCACVTTASGSIACISGEDLDLSEAACCEEDTDCPEDWYCVDFSGMGDCGTPDQCDATVCLPPCGLIPS